LYLAQGETAQPQRQHARQMALLSLRLAISFYLLSGMRFVFNIPMYPYGRCSPSLVPRRRQNLLYDEITFCK
jgi:hypothetical protein